MIQFNVANLVCLPILWVLIGLLGQSGVWLDQLALNFREHAIHRLSTFSERPAHGTRQWDVHANVQLPKPVTGIATAHSLDAY